MKKRLTIGRLAIYVILIGAASRWPSPWRLPSSARSANSPTLRAPVVSSQNTDAGNYQALFFPAASVNLDIGRWIANTLPHRVVHLITGTVAVLAGYVFAKLRFGGGKRPLCTCSHR